MLAHATWVFLAYPQALSPQGANARLMMCRHSTHPGALENLGIPLLKGREFSWQDTLETPYVAVVSESVATKLWPAQDPLGKRMRSAEGNFPWVTVIGVTLAVRTHADLQSTSNALRSAVLSLDPTLPVYDLALLDARLAEQVAPVRTMAIL